MAGIPRAAAGVIVSWTLCGETPGGTTTEPSILVVRTNCTAKSTPVRSSPGPSVTEAALAGVVAPG